MRLSTILHGCRLATEYKLVLISSVLCYRTREHFVDLSVAVSSGYRRQCMRRIAYVLR